MRPLALLPARWFWGVVLLLPLAPRLHSFDILCDWLEADREKLLRQTYQELPHAMAVMIDTWDEREDGLVEIRAIVLVERESQKPIVIGKGGERLKQVGTLARTELEELLGRKIFLELHVKTAQDWRNDDRILRQLGVE